MHAMTTYRSEGTAPLIVNHEIETWDSGQFHTLATLILGKQPPLPTEQEAGWTTRGINSLTVKCRAYSLHQVRYQISKLTSVFKSG